MQAFEVRGRPAAAMLAEPFRYGGPFVVVQGAAVIEQAASAELAVSHATRRLRQMIEQNAIGSIKVLDRGGHVVWREYVGD